MYASEAEFTDDPIEEAFFGCGGVCEIPDMQEKMIRLARGSSNFYAFHIHEFGDCSGDFQKAGGHYNPQGSMHPDHAGDLPPLLGNQGYAWASFYDKRFTINEIIGKSVIIHENRDDFTSQPSGDPGPMIGCGEIRRTL